MFLSKSYAEKPWTRHELENAQARAFNDISEYILPVRIDDTEIPGILSTTGYLDLRQKSIEEVHQALAQKLSGTTLQESSDNPTTTPIQEALADYVMIWSRDGIQYFIPFQSLLWDSTEISLELLPETPGETAFLRSLRSNPNSGYAPEVFPLALQDDAAWVSPQEVMQSTSGSKTIWKVVLKNVGNDQPFSFVDEIAIGNISPDQIAEMRARRILLNEKPMVDSSSPNQVDAFHQDSLESYIRGADVSRHETSIQVLESPIPSLYRNFGQTAGQFQKFARLVSVLFLKLSRTVDNILELEFELLSPEQLRVRFKGRRRQRYTNVEPYTIQVDGICPLSE